MKQNTNKAKKLRKEDFSNNTKNADLTEGKRGVNLRKNGFLRFQLALIIAMGLVYGGLETSFRMIDFNAPNKVEPIPEIDYWVSPEVIHIQKQKSEEVVKQVQKPSTRITEVPDNTDLTDIEKKVIETTTPPDTNPSYNGGDFENPEAEDENKVFNIKTVQEIPIFPGCENADDRLACFEQKMQKHVRRNFRYPEQEQDMNIKGKVYVLFKIDELGKVSDIKLRGPSKGLEKEAERVIKKLPVMIPGKANGKPVRVLYSLPIVVELK